MAFWILVTLAITTTLAALIAEILARHATAMTALAATAACMAAALDQWHETWAVYVFGVCTAAFLLIAAMYATRRKLPPYVLGSDDEDEDEA